MPNFSAVLVGINKYKSAPLRGCVNDVVIMRDLLVKKYGVAAKQIRMLVDERATKAAILERLNWLVANDAPNKLFHYSGHGAQYPNQPYDKDDFEPDGMDEILCPVDFNWQDGFITDDQIDGILAKMDDDHHITMVFDCCHSGTVHRDMITVDRLARRIETPLDIKSRMSSVPLVADLDTLEYLNTGSDTKGFDLNQDFFELFEAEQKPVNSRSTKKSKHNVSIITGCLDKQTSADAWVGTRYQGALSFVMQGHLLRQPDISLAELRSKCAKTLKQYGFDQVPQFTCNEENRDLPFIRV